MHIKELVSRYPALEKCEAEIRAAFELLKNSYEASGKLLVCGNGGSCADSDHICGELLKSFVKKREVEKSLFEKISEVDSEAGEFLAARLQGSLPAISLCAHSALMTACLNDVDGNAMFAQQVMGFGNAGDVFLGISTSGNSRDVIYAAALAKAKGLKTVGLLGKNGGRLAKICDVAIIVPENETFKIQEFHLPIYHALCLQIEENFWKE